jgi:alpha-galactosidase
MKNQLLLLISFFLFASVSAQKFEGLALTPPMGWNSWNTFQTNISEDLIKQTADVMVASGMKDAGYEYIVLDDGWMAKERDSSGNLVPDPIKFPHGMKALIDYVHEKGLKFGLYNCAGTKTCAGYPGTRGYEYQDARFYAELGIDYLKYDWCNTEGINAKEAYGTMSKALRTAGRPIVFSLCEWGENKPWEWAKDVGHLWRTSGDIYACFDCELKHDTWSQWGVMRIIDKQKDLYKYAGPGHWNDPDMLEVGNGMTENQDRAHFSIWCISAAPLMAGNDITKMSDQTKNILTSKEVIAIDQDKAGMQGFVYKIRDSVEIWVKPLSDSNWAVCFLNRSNVSKNINFNWQNELIKDTVDNQIMDAKKTNYQLRNLWTKLNMGDTKKALKASIPPQDVLMLKLIIE